MKSLTLPQQSNSSYVQSAHKYSFPKIQRLPAFLKRILPAAKMPESLPPVESFVESDTRVDAQLSMQEQQELTVNGEEMASPFLESDIRMEQVLALYSIEDLKAVESFLEENTFLIPLLFATYLNIVKYFSYSQVTLDVETDYEYPTHQELAAYVVTNLPVEEALQQLERFDEQWWLNVLDQAQSKFDVDLRFE
jgi:hypothetical protein